jgi:ArsR family transcriptional regulator, arsenate/arsenite/antimonite-responsive transcriptional repressor
MENRQFEKVAKALADGRRFKIFQTVAETDGICCGAVCEQFNVSQATVSHHLKELTESGLLDVRSEGQFKYWKVNTGVINRYISELKERLNLK